MSGHQVEVIHRDAAAFMHLPHRRAGVRPGPAERRGQEFDLLGFEPFMFDPAKKPDR